jgi:mannose-6-phosphate isomerase-like protein (cupin superfamily)
LKILEGAGRYTSGDGPNDYVEHLRNDSMSVGTYCIPAGGVDDQTPHTEDEIYVVVEGRAKIVGGDESASLSRGSVVFVPAGEEHRFVEISENLTTLVFFAPAEGTSS